MKYRILSTGLLVFAIQMLSLSMRDDIPTRSVSYWALYCSGYAAVFLGLVLLPKR